MITNPNSFRGEKIFEFQKGHIRVAQKVRCDLRNLYMCVHLVVLVASDGVAT